MSSRKEMQSQCRLEQKEGKETWGSDGEEMRKSKNKKETVNLTSKELTADNNGSPKTNILMCSLKLWTGLGVRVASS
jgi:hypothetical protein